MSFHKLFRISIAVSAIWGIGLFVVPAGIAQSPITCTAFGVDCSICFDQCVNGVICQNLKCPGSPAVGSCGPCYIVKKQPGDFQNQKGTHGEQGDKVLLARLLSKDPEVSQALRSLK